MALAKLILALSPILALILQPAPLITDHSSRIMPHVSLTIPDRRFGVVETYDDPASAAAIGAGWTRVRFPWSDLQPNNDGEWNSTFFADDRLAAELAVGREVVGLIVNTPHWALDDPTVPGVPRGLYLPESDPGNVWATFVRQIVSRYAGRVDRWIIWNEPDIWDPAYPGRTWGGTVQEFFQLQRVAYNVAKQTNPQAQVHLSAFTYFWDANYGRTPFFSLLMDEIQKDPQSPSHDYYFDVASANLYFNADNIYDLIVWHHGQMQARGFDKPIWLTETNAPPSSDPSWPVADPAFPISLDEQAAFVPQAFAMALAAGATRVAVYKMIDTPGDRAANPEPFGLAREDGSRRPAFAAYQVAAGALAGFTGASLDVRDERYTQVTVRRGEATTTVLWARSPSPVQVQVQAHEPQAILADAFGGRRAIAPRDGAYVVDLPGCTQPRCAIGGAPRILIEGAAVSPVAPAPGSSTGQPIVQPTGAPTGTPTQQPTATSSPTGAPTHTPSPTRTPTAFAAPTSAPAQSLDPVPMSGEALPPATTSGPDALFIAIGVVFGALIAAYALARFGPPPGDDLS